MNEKEIIVDLFPIKLDDALPGMVIYYIEKTNGKNYLRELPHTYNEHLTDGMKSKEYYLLRFTLNDPIKVLNYLRRKYGDDYKAVSFKIVEEEPVLKKDKGRRVIKSKKMSN